MTLCGQRGEMLYNTNESLEQYTNNNKVYYCFETMSTSKFFARTNGEFFSREPKEMLSGLPIISIFNTNKLIILILICYMLSHGGKWVGFSVMVMNGLYMVSHGGEWVVWSVMVVNGLYIWSVMVVKSSALQYAIII